MGRFDLSFKALAETSPRTLLRLFAHQPLDDSTAFEPLERELAMSLKSVDQAFVLTRNGDQWVEHFEAEIALSDEDRKQILNRAALLHVKTGLRVWTTVVLLSKRRSKPWVTEPWRSDGGGIVFQMQPKVIALWEQSPDLVLQDPSPEGLPIVGAMRPDRGALERVVDRLAQVRNPELFSRLKAELVTWSSLSYGKLELAAIRERLSMVTFKDILQEGPLWDMIVEEYKAEVLSKGLSQGLSQGLRSGLYRAARKRFPLLELSSEIDSIDDTDTLNDLIDAVVAAPTDAEASKAIAAILKK